MMIVDDDDKSKKEILKDSLMMIVFVDFLCVMDTVSNGTHILYPVHIRTDTSCLILEILHANYFL